MCGINGFVAGSSIAKEKATESISRMNNEIVHRGPDDEGFYFEQSYNYSVSFAMRRLSIIDLYTGKQPIFSEDNRKVIVFNGEIYNYSSLKNGLIKEGISFKTDSDTEVIVNLYERYGVEAFGMLDGMFAFSIYDKDLKKVFIARDFFGEKPLYYTKNSNGFYWASELKSILDAIGTRPGISVEAMNIYFQLTYIPAPHTIYQGVYKLEANHYLEYDCSNQSFSIKEIRQSFEVLPKPKNFNEAKESVHDLVQKSVQSRTVSDVPIGTFLSGGVDSSVVSYCVASNSSSKINTFSIGFERKDFDESEKAITVAKLINSNHHQFIIGERDLTKNTEEVLLNFDEPFADSSALASYLVAHKTSASVKVALTGDGGDEVFGGYNKYYMGKLNGYYTDLVPRTLHNSIKKAAIPLLTSKDDKRGIAFRINRLLKSINYEGDFYYNIIALGFQENEIPKFIKEDSVKNNILNYYKTKAGNKSKSLTDFRNIDRLISLEGDMLVKVDRTSMLTSLECRAPFLNKALWSYANNLPEAYLMKGWDKKHILKKAFEQYFPKDFLNKSKKGFGVPVGDWLRGALKKELLSFVDKDFITKQNIFIADSIIPLVLNHVDGRQDNTFRVWTFYCFQKWYKNNYN